MASVGHSRTTMSSSAGDSSLCGIVTASPSSSISNIAGRWWTQFCEPMHRSRSMTTSMSNESPLICAGSHDDIETLGAVFEEVGHQVVLVAGRELKFAGAEMAEELLYRHLALHARHVIAEAQMWPRTE